MSTFDYEAKEAYLEKFQTIIDQLNPQQLEAVNTIEGPVLAIAGPGTGKTHILGARIGQILLNTDTQPHNILCLTFTDAGVQAMRKRLVEFIGPAAHRVNIYTFHSYCNKIIQDNLELFGYNDLEKLSDLERIDIIRSILDRLDYTHPLKAHTRDPYYYEGHLANIFKLMKSENWLPEHLSLQIDLYLEDLPKREEYQYKTNRGEHKKGDVKEIKIAEQQEKMERLRSAAALYTEYKQILTSKRRYDYDDMILWVLDAFRNTPFLLRSQQEQYLYVHVDEFQDTNGAQSDIIHELLSYWQHSPNIFIVGDDDQSIYEFQGARIKNMLDFYERFKIQHPN